MSRALATGLAITALTMSTVACSSNEPSDSVKATERLPACRPIPTSGAREVSLRVDFPGSGNRGIATLTNSRDRPIKFLAPKVLDAFAVTNGSVVSAPVGAADGAGVETLNPHSQRKLRVGFFGGLMCDGTDSGERTPLPSGRYNVVSEVNLTDGSKIVSPATEAAF